MPKPRSWSWLERLPGLSTSRIDWMALLGSDFEWVQKFLQPTQRRAESLSCPVCAIDCCRRRVVCHGPADYVSIGNECGRRFVVSERDLVIYEVNIRRLSDRLSRALGLHHAFEACRDLYQTWRLGFHAARRIPVFLSAQHSTEDLHQVVSQLGLNSEDSFILLLPTTNLLNESGRRLLDRVSTGWLPLERLICRQPDGRLSAPMDWDRRLGRESGASASPTAATGTPDDENGKTLLARREMPDGIHWFVDGQDKGVFFKNEKAIKARVLEILFDQIGHGWVPHQTFINACGWTKKHYFGESSEARLIQKHLTDIRKFLGIREVSFNKKRGVRFPENVVKSKR